MISLNKIASGLINHITGVIKDQVKFPISHAQIKEDIVSLRESLIIKSALSKEIPNSESIQTIIIPIRKDEFGDLVSLVPRFIRTPGLTSITYAGDINHSFTIQVVFDEQGRFIKNNPFTANVPTMWITDHKCQYFNLENRNIDKVYIKGFLRDPRQLREFDPLKYSDDSVFPLSGVMKNQIEDQLIQRYLITFKDKTQVNASQVVDEKMVDTKRKG